MRNFLQTANLGKDMIAQTAQGVYKAILQKCNINSLKEFDVNNIEHLGYFYLSVDTGFGHLDRVGGTNSATKLYKLLNSEFYNQFGTFKHQWLMLLSFITSVGAVTVFAP